MSDKDLTVHFEHDRSDFTRIDRDPIDQLEKLARLHDQGYLTDGEFRRAKRQAGLGRSVLGTLATVGIGVAALALIASAGSKKS